MLTPFRIHEPARLDEAVALLEDLSGSAAVYAGGTELLVALKQGFLSFEHLIDIKRIPELQHVQLLDGHISIGAAVAYSSLVKNPLLRQFFPELVELIGRIANIRVRAAGTLGGNLVFSEPRSDPAVFMLMLDAEVECVGSNGSRLVPLSDFLVGPYESALAPAELLARIRVKMPPNATGIHFQRFCVYERPTANAGARINVDKGRVSAAAIVTGASSPVPLRHTDLEKSLLGLHPEDIESITPQLIERLEDRVDVMEDTYGSADYKRHLTGELTRRALSKASARLRGDHVSE